MQTPQWHGARHRGILFQKCAHTTASRSRYAPPNCPADGTIRRADPDRYRNSQIVPVTPSVYEEDDENFTLLETMNVVPGDSLTYHFYVSNFNSVTGDQNIIDGLFFPNTNATLSLPMKGEIYNVNSTILYREVPYDSTDTTTPSNNVWNNLVEGNYLDLPPVSVRKVRYEFKVTVVVDDQVEDTDHEDYFDAVLTIKLFINAASDE